MASIPQVDGLDDAGRIVGDVWQNNDGAFGQEHAQFGQAAIERQGLFQNATVRVPRTRQQIASSGSFWRAVAWIVTGFRPSQRRRWLLPFQ
jgi:anti-sigma-K factor RskA